MLRMSCAVALLVCSASVFRASTVTQPVQPGPFTSCKPVEKDMLDFVQANPAPTDVPAEWRHPGAGFSFTPIADDNIRELYRRALFDEVQKYRLDRLKQFVRRIWIVGTLHVSGIGAIGTQGGGEVWIAIGSAGGARYSEWDVRLALHHEIACQIFDAVPGGLPNDNWRGVTPQGYLDENPADAVKAGHGSTALSFDLARTGFLNEYARSGVMKDFAAIHELSMMAPHEMCFLAERNDLLARKHALWEAFVSEHHLLQER